MPAARPPVFWITAVFLGCIAPTLHVSAQPDPSPPEMLQDAELTAVTFIDADRGWAVGDRGVIWHTSDGGRAWKLQNSGVTCRLEAVQFLDPDNGFIVGGWTQSYTHESHGIALRTRDGGRTWQNTPDLTLPGLRHVRFFNGRQGLALGDSSSLYPAGVFRSEDGGRTWSPIAKGESLGWATGDFRDATSGAAAGLDGRLGLIAGNELRASRTPPLGPRYLRRMLLSGPTGGWLIGDGGLVLTTNDGGFTWTAPAGALPEEAGREFDFRALAAHGNQVWLAGAPGTCIVHSPDGGQTWQIFRTEHTPPLRGLCFIDEYRGWAVGSLGNILHTRDGGRSWRVQQSGGTRAALLGIASELTRVPLEVIASQGGSDAFLTAIEIIGRQDQGSGSRCDILTARNRVHHAVVAAGGSTADVAWRWPLGEAALMESSDAVLARWNIANDGQAVQRLEEHLVRRIRQWRPEVIVTEDVAPRGENALAFIINQTTLAAVTKAADATAYSEQITRTGLAAWKVKKVFGVLPGGKQGVVNITPAQWEHRLGRSVAEQAELGRSLIMHEVTTAPRNIGLTLLVDRLPQDTGKRGVMSGIALQAGGEARRRLSDPPPGNLEALSQIAQKRHNVEQLLDRIESDATVGAGWLGQVSELTKGLSPRATGEILYQLGRKYQQVGKCSQAAEAMQMLLDKHPQHPLADAAALWLIQYYASGEVALRERRDTKFEVSVATAVAPKEAPASAASGADKSKQPQDIVQASFAGVTRSRTAAPQLNPAERAGRALALGKQIEQTRPTLYADPALRFSLAATARQAGQPRIAERFFQTLATASPESLWAKSAACEHWLVKPNENPPKKLCSVVTALQKPRLDGRLDDPLWQVAKPISLTSQDGKATDAPAVAVMAFDSEFLYFAVSCRKAPGVDYPPANASRVGDSDLTTRDRVTIMLDIDRDYASFWSLTIDHRGWPAESCFGDATWNPQWFIAAGGDKNLWTVEAAIPLAEISAKPPQVRDIWALGVQRVIPRIGLQSFTQPAAIEPRAEAFGLMVFE